MTDDEGIYQKIKLLRDHGRESNGNISVWGFNSRLDNLQAAILDFFLSKYNQTIKRRRYIAKMYHERLKDLSWLSLPPAPDHDSDHYDIYQNYEIEAEMRDDLIDFLSNNGIGTLIQWGGKAVHQFQDLGFTQSLPFTEQIMRRSLMLPLNMSVSDGDIDYICGCVRDFYDD